MKSQPDSLQKELDRLLNEITVELGFMLTAEVKNKILTADFYDAESFTNDVFGAEDMDPDENLRLKRQVRKKFTDRFGASFSSETGNGT